MNFFINLRSKLGPATSESPLCIPFRNAGSVTNCRGEGTLYYSGTDKEAHKAIGTQSRKLIVS